MSVQAQSTQGFEPGHVPVSHACVCAGCNNAEMTIAPYPHLDKISIPEGFTFGYGLKCPACKCVGYVLRPVEA